MSKSPEPVVNGGAPGAPVGQPVARQLYDPFLAGTNFLGRWMIPGLGMYTEGYIIFSIGNITPILAAEYPYCFGKKTPTRCDITWTQATSYLQIVGIAIGQIFNGIFGDAIGRRRGSILSAFIMLLGTIWLTLAQGYNEEAFVVCFACAQFFFGLGVGGEYPMAASSANERAEASALYRSQRGRETVLTFSMQGVGQFMNIAFLCVAILIFGGASGYGGSPPTYNPSSMGALWRTSFAFTFPTTLFMLYWRVFQLRESSVYMSEKASSGVAGYDWVSARMMITTYWHRLFCTCFTWFANDFAFYGNKLFQSTFIKSLNGPNASLEVTFLYTLINSGVALVGYYFSAFFIDNPFFGRLRIQAVGFFWLFILFLLCAVLYPELTASPAGLHGYQFLYFFSSFWNQFGPNCTTFLTAAEVFPTPIRATAHGIAAAAGKMGALAPAILYNYIGTRTKFWVVTWFGLAGLIVTVIFLPDYTGLDLTEGDRRWEYLRNGRGAEYHGEAVNPRFLSMFEHRVLRYSRLYDPVADAEARKIDAQKQARYNYEYTAPDNLQGYGPGPANTFQTGPGTGGPGNGFQVGPATGTATAV